MANVLDYDIVVSEFELILLRSLSRYYAWKRYEAPNHLSYGLNKKTFPFTRMDLALNNPRRNSCPKNIIIKETENNKFGRVFKKIE